MEDDTHPDTQGVSVTTYVLVTIFGIGSWVAMNGIWVELPNLVNQVPEGWHLPSYMTVICQLANIGPIVYSLLQKYMHDKDKFLRITVYISLIIGIFACVLLTFTWKTTAFINNKEISVALLGSVFLISLVDCTSSVTFLPFMVILPSLYMSPLYIGETLSGLLPGLLALAQGIESNEVQNKTSINYNESGLLFPQEVFFGLLAFMMLMCLCAFVGLNTLHLVKKDYVDDAGLTSDYNAYVSDGNNDETTSLIDSSIVNSEYGKKIDLKILLGILVLLNLFQNGITASISSYTYAPYGLLTYHLAATLGPISSAVSCFLYLWFPCRSKKVIYVDAVMYAILVTYSVLLAIQSPNPWLKDTIIGKIIVVLVSIISNALVSFTKLSIASVMRKCGQKYLFWAGVSNQVGSFLGAVLMFPLVNFTDIFSG